MKEFKMKQPIFIIAAISLLLVLIGMMACHSEPKPKQSVKLTNFADSLSYTLGYIIGVEVSEVDFEVNKKVAVAGFINALFNVELLTEDEMMDLFEAFHEKMTERRVLENEQLKIKNQLAGEAFMIENAKQPGVLTTESGLQYRVIKSGTGKHIKAGDTITAHYTAKFLDGEIFQSTQDRAEPITFNVDIVLDGWSEGLKMMREGDYWELFLPDSLAFGSEGFEVVEPGAYLIFEVEVISIK
jgi:FKBP-type peptidyl-prolyl cis-trans isomerase